MSQQEWVVIRDAAIPVRQVRVAHAAGLDLHDHIVGAGLRDHDIGEFNRLSLGASNDSLHCLSHLFLQLP